MLFGGGGGGGNFISGNVALGILVMAGRTRRDHLWSEVVLSLYFELRLRIFTTAIKLKEGSTFGGLYYGSLVIEGDSGQAGQGNITISYFFVSI